MNRLGKILTYFGGVADRLEQIASIGADGLVMEDAFNGSPNKEKRPALL